VIVGIEVGGTFTDLVMVDDAGRLSVHKLPSTPRDPSVAAVAGLREILEAANTSGDAVSELLHGSTIAANALIQRRGARTALITTRGFRDVLFIQRQDKTVVYDMFYQKAEPLLTRDLVHEVTERMGADGAFAAETAPDALAIECSTLSHDWVLAFGPEARERGFRPIDCPVTGRPENAADGELTLLVGAEESDLEAARPLLKPLCAEIIHFGAVGAGTAYKLMVNLMGAVQIVATAEGLLIAEKAGLDMEKVGHALSCGAAASRQVIRNSRRMVDADHDRNITFSGRWRLKDALYGLRLARKLGQATPLGDAAAEAFQKLVDAGLGELSESKVIDTMRS